MCVYVYNDEFWPFLAASPFLIPIPLLLKSLSFPKSSPTLMSVCVSLTSVACTSIGKQLFVGAWAAYQWLHHWTNDISLPQLTFNSEGSGASAVSP